MFDKPPETPKPAEGSAPRPPCVRPAAPPAGVVLRKGIGAT